MRTAIDSTFVNPDDFFRDETEQELRDLPEFPVKQLADLVGRIEERRTGLVSNLLLLVATLLGVALGAGLTALLS